MHGTAGLRNNRGMYRIARRREGDDGVEELGVILTHGQDVFKENGVGTNGRRSRWGLPLLSGKSF